MSMRFVRWVSTRRMLYVHKTQWFEHRRINLCICGWSVAEWHLFKLSNSIDFAILTQRFTWIAFKMVRTLSHSCCALVWILCVCLEKSDRDASEFISHVHCLLAIQSRIQSGLYFLRIQTSRVCFGFINSRRKSKNEECPNFRYRLQRECVRICNIGRRSCAQHSQGMQSRPFDVVRMLSIYQSKKSDKNIAQP